MNELQLLEDADLVEKHCRQARKLREGLEQAGIDSCEIWFGQTSWQGEVACRLSLSSWRTRDEDIERTIEILSGLTSAEDKSYASSIC